MFKKLASLMIRLTANGAEAEAEFRKLERRVATFGKDMKKWGDSLTKYVTLPMTALGGVAVKLANTQQQAEAKLLTALRGREDVQKRLIAQAGELQSRTTFGDEAIIEQQSYLAALGLTEQQIGDTISAAVQLSAALGMELDAAVKNLGKTFGGLTGELGESIPALKELTSEQLKSGEAIKFVNDNYKGFAETAATTGTGSLQQLKNQLGDIGEQLGVILLPALQELVKMLKDVADWLSHISPATLKIVAVIGGAAAAIGPLVLGLAKMITHLKTFIALVPALFKSSKILQALKLGRLGAYIPGVERLSPEEWMGDKRAAAFSSFDGTASSVARFMLDQAPEIEAEIEAVTEAVNDLNNELEKSEVLVEKVVKKLPTVTAASPNLSGLTTPTEGGVLTSIKNLGLRSTGLTAFRNEMLNADEWQAMAKEAENIARLSQSIGAALQQAFANVATAVGEGIAALITNADFDPLQKFLSILGELLSQLGAALISFATAKATAEIALKGGSWPVALAAGIAAVAAGVVLKNLANKPVKLATGGLAYGPTLAVVGDNPGAKSDPEVVAPLSKLREYMGGAQRLELVGDIELVAQGSSLRAVLNRENVRLAYLG